MLVAGNHRYWHPPVSWVEERCCGQYRVHSAVYSTRSRRSELMAGCAIESVYTGIAGSHIKSLNSHGIVAIRDREVYSQDVERVIDAAQAMAIPADQKILHVLPQEFLIDAQEGVKEPLGMSGVRLELRCIW